MRCASVTRAVLSSVIALQFSSSTAGAVEVVLSPQGEYLDAYVLDGTEPPARRVFIDPDPPDPSDPSSHARVGRHVNGRLCFFPSDAPEAFQGKFVIADDTYREACVENTQGRCAVTDESDPSWVGTDPDGWGVFNADGTWAKKVIRTPWDFPGDPDAVGTVDPQGCVFDAAANLYGNDVGGADPTNSKGALVVFFASSGYDDYCLVATGMAQPGVPVLRDDAIYVPQSGGGVITKFTGPFPQGPGDCEPDENGRPVPRPEFRSARETIVPIGSLTPISMVPRSSLLGLPVPVRSWYVASILVPPSIDEYDENGILVRPLVAPFVPDNPIAIDVASDETIWFAELDVQVPSFDTGCGRVSRIPFFAGLPLPPEVLAENLRFPDGLTITDTGRFAVDFAALPLATAGDPADCLSE